VVIFKIISYYPKSEEGLHELKRKVADIHIQAINRCIENLACPIEEKIDLYNEVVTELQLKSSSP